AANAGCLTVFGSIFFLARAFVVEQSIFGVVDTRGTRLGMAGMGTLFMAVGGLIIYGGLWAGRMSRRENAAREAHPDEPWLWRPEWSVTTISDSSNAIAIGSWIFAIIWNAIAWPAAFAAIHAATPAPPRVASSTAHRTGTRAMSRPAPRAAAAAALLPAAP